jgi:hypothetical protein
MSDDDTSQLTPERTLFANGKAAPSADSITISADAVSVMRNIFIQSIIQAKRSQFRQALTFEFYVSAVLESHLTRSGSAIAKRS